jgi:hypothetical protein
MKRTTGAQLPRMRKQNLIIDELPDEVLIYDLDRHKAHCLNSTAALVWRRCNGKTRPAEIARYLQSELDQPFNEELVWLALRQLDKIHLLAEPIGLPPKLAGMSRREMVRTLGIAAAVPLVITSIVAPTAGQAATCGHNGNNCGGTNPPCCSPLVCKTTFKCGNP